MRVTTYASITVAIETSCAAFFPFRRFLFSLLFYFYGVYRDARMTRADTDAGDNRGSWFRPAKSSWDVEVYCGSRDVILLSMRFESRDGTAIYVL